MAKSRTPLIAQPEEAMHKKKRELRKILKEVRRRPVVREEAMHIKIKKTTEANPETTSYSLELDITSFADRTRYIRCVLARCLVWP